MSAGVSSSLRPLAKNTSDPLPCSAYSRKNSFYYSSSFFSRARLRKAKAGTYRIWAIYGISPKGGCPFGRAVSEAVTLRIR